MKSHGASRALAVALGTLLVSTRLAGQALAGVAGATLPAALTPALTGIRIDPVAGHTELSIAAEGAAFHVSPPVMRAGHVRLVVDLPGTRLGQLEGPSLPPGNGAILALRASDDDAGTRLTVDIVQGARFEARPGTGGLLLVIQGGGAPATAWAVATAGRDAPRIQPITTTTAAPAPAAAGPSAAVTGPHSVRAAPAPRAQLRPRVPARTALAAGWAPPASGPVSATAALLLMALVLAPPCLALHLARRRAKATAAPPDPRLHTVFPDGTRRRSGAGWLAPGATHRDALR